MNVTPTPPNPPDPISANPLLTVAWVLGWQSGYRAACQAVKTEQLELFRVDL